MKKFAILCVSMLLFMGINTSEAAPKGKAKTATTVFKTDIHCHMCVNKIMNNVPVLGRGVKDIKVDLDKKEVTVVYDATKNNDEKIIEGFSSLKVNAQPIKKEGKEVK